MTALTDNHCENEINTARVCIVCVAPTANATTKTSDVIYQNDEHHQAHILFNSWLQSQHQTIAPKIAKLPNELAYQTIRKNLDDGLQSNNRYFLFPNNWKLNTSPTHMYIWSVKEYGIY